MQIVRDRAGTGTAPIRACVLTAAAVAALVMAAAAGPAGAALDAPQNLQAAVMSQTAVQLTWTSSNPSGLEDSYVVERSRYATTAFTAVAEIPATTTSYQDTGLASGTTYYYRVYARTKKGDTAYSNIASATTPGTPPSAPSSLNATAVSSGQIELTWRDNSSNESGFRIERSFYATSGFTQIAVVGANVKSYSNTGLPSSTTYYYRVRAYNSYGASAYSNTAGATTQSTLSLPAAPSDLRATAVSSTQINLTWQDNSTNESGFRIERSHYATSGFTQIAVVGANVTSYANTGLASSTTYYYRVRAYNAYGNSAYSNTASATTSVVMLTPPDAPSGLSAVGGAGRIDLTWVDNSDNETNFDLWRLPSAGAWVNIEHPGANVRSYSDFDVEPGLTYWYVVRAENGAGVSGWSNVASATATATQPQPPAAPYGLSATAVSSSEITLWWSDNSANEAGFRIERSFYPTSGFVQIATVPANVTAYQNFGLAGNTTYYYRVRAYNAYGNSAYSNTAWATTLIVPPAAPSNLRATAASTNRIDLTWTDNSNYEIGFKVERSPSASSGFVQVATVAANVSVYQDTGLSPSTTYYYRVRAYNAYGNSTYSNTAWATTQGVVTLEVGTAVDVVTDGAYAYVASEEHGVVVVDVRNAANPLAVGATEVGFVPTYLDCEGTIVVAAGGDAGMAVVDVSDPSAPTWVSSLGGPAHEVTVAGGHAYVADATAGTPGYLRVVDLWDSSNPTVVAEVELGRLPREVAIVGDYAYVATSNKICVLDVSVPASAHLVSSPSIGCARITAKPGFAYIPGGMVSGIAVVDTSDPNALSVLGEAESLCYLNRFVVQGNLVYAAGTSMYTSIPYLQIFDVTAPTAPFTTSYRSISGTGTAESVAVSGDHAYLADGPDGLKVIDVSDPYNMVVVGHAQ